MVDDCTVAVGLQWGDEGKGKLIDWLAARARHVARFQGGHNAGHTIVADGRKVVLHLVPSGILHPHCRCYIGAGVVLSMAALLDELQQLAAAGIDCSGRLTISPDCTLILPHHQALDGAREDAGGGIGTTRRGIGPAHEDRVGRRAVRLRHVLAGDFQDILATAMRRANIELVHLHGVAPVDVEEVANLLPEQAQRLKDHVGDVAAGLMAARAAKEPILLEAAQGALLDIDQGTYPFVTSSTCLAAGAAPGLGVDLRPTALGIAKCYTTRVGNGPFPTEIDGKVAERLTSTGEEYGATTARQRRVGWLDIPALRHAVAANGCDSLALTKLDVLGSLDTVQVCTAHDASWAATATVLDTLAPVYEQHDGWGDLADADSYAALPVACRSYVDRVAELVGVPVSCVSVGKDREATFAVP